MNKKAFILVMMLDNLIVSIAMAITASILSGVWDIYTILTIPFAFTISTIMELIISWGRISNWFSRLFKLKDHTMPSRLVGGLFTNIFITAILSFSCKLLVFKGDFKQAFDVFISTYIVMYIVSYIVYEISNFIMLTIVKKYSKKI